MTPDSLRDTKLESGTNLTLWEDIRSHGCISKKPHPRREAISSSGSERRSNVPLGQRLLEKEEAGDAGPYPTCLTQRLRFS